MAVVRKTKTASKGTKTTSRPAAKKTTATKSTRTTSARSTTKKPTTRATATKAPATRTRKKVEVTPTRTAKAANARATGAKGKTSSAKGKATTTKKPTTSRSVKTVAKPSATPKTGPHRVVDDTTGFAIGTDSHLIAMELLQGGADRAEIIERCAKKLPPTSNRGTPKPVANMVASVLGKMKDQGFTIESSWVLTPPTRASKARATRERNKRLGK